jgi:hypothetical protein
MVYEGDAMSNVGDWCLTGEKHCVCVPGLREEIARLTAQINEHEEAEAAVCPEDVGCIEYIKTLTARLAEVERENVRLAQEHTQCHEQNSRLVSEHYILRADLAASLEDRP